MLRVCRIALLPLILGGCSLAHDAVTPVVDHDAVFQYGSYCSAPPDTSRSALSYAETGFAYVEQQCGVFFDNLSTLTQSGRFTTKALNSINLGSTSILQATKVAASNVTIIGSAITLSEAVFNSFVEQYAFSPYLYKIRELTWQAFTRHSTDNNEKLRNLKSTHDDYCTAYVLVQQHASICTISYIQMLFDQQVAASTAVVPSMANTASQSSKITPTVSQTRQLTFSPKGNTSAPERSVLAAPPSYTVR